MSRNAARLDLEELPAWRDGDCLVVIEAPARSRTKLKFDAKLGVLVLHAVLPLGTSFPYSFGFIPSTLGEDGDPLDALVFLDEPVPPGTVVPCRLIGVIEAEQTEKRKTLRNDRLLAVSVDSKQYAHCRHLADLAPETLEGIEAFYVFLNAQKRRRFAPLRRGGSRRAETVVRRGERARKRARRD